MGMQLQLVRHVRNLQSRCSNLPVIIIQTQITLNDRSQPWKFNNSKKFINTCGRSNSVIITGKIAHRVL